MNISITCATTPKPKPDLNQDSLPFGKIFTDHMFLMEYAPETGWHNARIEPYAPIAFDPSASCLHYGQLIFEGMKAYKNSNDQVSLFRPFDNARRFNKSAARLCMPQIDPDFMVLAISKLLELDADWVPSMPDTAMYIRPFMLAADNSIALPPSQTYLFAIILSPTGHLYKHGLAPLKIWVEDKYVRAAPGGTGFAKCAGNYAGASIAGIEAQARGFNQVLWLDAVHRKYIEEVSAMNVFFVIDGTVITPASSGTILDGVTRNSVVEILKHWKIPVEERPIAIDELAAAHDAGYVTEVFCTGTAATVSPIGEICWGKKQMCFGDKKIGNLTQKLYDQITGIQTGVVADEFGWVLVV